MRVRQNRNSACLSIWLLSMLLIISVWSEAQNVSINKDGTAPDPSAMLDVSSTTQGMLVPRMTEVERDAISNPATGLLIYQTDADSGFYYNQGSPSVPDWQQIISDANLGEPVSIQDSDGDTRIRTESASSVNNDTITFELSGNEEFIFNGGGQILTPNSNASLYIGDGVGNGNGTFGNVALGFKAFEVNQTSINNVAVGTQSLGLKRTGNANAAVGAYSLYHNTEGASNTALGYSAGYGNTTDSLTGDFNVFVGREAGVATSTGSSNVLIGYQSGYNITSGSKNVFLGNQAGFNETSSDKLYIENSSSSSPLIYGDFSADSLVVNGKLNVGGNYVFPNSSGTADQVLKYNASGTALEWGSVASDTPTLISDTDGNTQIQTEENTNENIIRFDVDGSEVLRIHDNSRLNVTNTNSGVYIGSQAGSNISSGTQNSFLGYEAGASNSSGGNNTFLGYRAGYLNSTTSHNTFIGALSGDANNSGSENTFMGVQSGSAVNSGSHNTIIGKDAGRILTTGHNNTFLGIEAGEIVSTSSSGNVFLGAYAGSQLSSANDLLVIDNSDTLKPLIYGDFANDSLKVYGTLSIGDSIFFPTTRGTNEQVLQTDGNGQLSWQSLGGGNTLDAAYDQGGSGSGRTITADNGALHVAGTDGIMVTGTLGSGSNVGVTGAGVRMFFNPKTGAFRAGSAAGTNWDQTNLGSNSVSMGSNTIATGTASISIGTATNASASNAVVLGYNSNASATQSSALGSNVNANGLGSMAMGSSSTASGNYSNTLGFGVLSRSQGEVAIGMNNTDYTPNSTSSYNANDRILVVGNGSSTASKSDALIVLKSGDTEINGSLTLDNANNGSGYTFPTSSGTADQVLKYNSAGTALEWGTLSGDGNGIYDGNGSLSTNSTVSFGNADLNFDLTGLGKFEVQDNGLGVFQVDETGNSYFGGDVQWGDADVAGTVLATLTDEGNDGRLQIYENGISSIDLNASGNTVFNGQGLDRNFQIESENDQHIFFVNAGTDRIGIGTSSPDSLFDIAGGAEVDRLSIGGNYTFPTSSPSASGEVLRYNGTNLEWGSAADNMGDHTATTTIQLNGNRISNDGDSEGLSVSNTGQVTGTPATTGAGNTAFFANGDYRTSGQGTGIYFSNTNIGITGNNSNSGDMRFKTGSTDRLLITSTGQVGINESNPGSGYRLDVGGAVTVNSLNINDNYTLPTSAPSANDVLTYNGFSLVWGSVSSVSSSISDDDGNTQIQVEETTNENIIRFDLNGAENFVMNSNRLEFTNANRGIYIGTDAGLNDGELGNVFIGDSAGTANSTGEANTLIGFLAGKSLDDFQNTIVGYETGNNMTSGFANVAVGDLAMQGNGGNENTVIGSEAFKTYSGSANVAIGSGALGDGGTSMTYSGSNNIAIGAQAGAEVNGSNNILIGLSAGQGETISNQLRIDELIYGDFSLDSLVVNGTLTSRDGLFVTSGFLGVGTANPNHIFEMQTSSTGDEPMVYLNNNTSNGDAFFLLETNGSQNFSFGVDGSGNENFVISNSFDLESNQRFVIDGSSGNVGIGTITPDNMLSIYNGSSGAYFDVKSVGDANNFAGFTMASDEATDKSWTFLHRKVSGELNNFAFEYFDGSTYSQKLVIEPNGFVGIGDGNVDPTSRLDVEGSIEIDGSASGSPGDDAFYFGNPDTDGSWRIKRDGNDLSFERRESGTWVFKVKMNP